MTLTLGVKDVLILLAKYRTFRKMGFFFFLSYLFPRQCRKRLHTSVKKLLLNIKNFSHIKKHHFLKQKFYVFAVPQGLTLFLRKNFSYPHFHTKITSQKVHLPTCHYFFQLTRKKFVDPFSIQFSVKYFSNFSKLKEVLT